MHCSTPGYGLTPSCRTPHISNKKVSWVEVRNCRPERNWMVVLDESVSSDLAVEKHELWDPVMNAGVDEL